MQEVRAEVARQIETMTGLNQSAKGAGRSENLFEDQDLQMAGYAAQRMCPACGLITPRSKTACLECGKVFLGPAK